VSDARTTISGFSVVDISTNRLDFKCLISDGSVIDYFTIIHDEPAAPITPDVVTPAQVTNGVFGVGFEGTVGITYTIQSKNTLNDSWQSRTNITVPAEGIIRYQEPMLGLPQRFYRAIYPAQ
jgi:hypothetical protein